LGGLLALLGALYENTVRAVTVQHGLADYLSILESPFAYVPHDIVVPDIFDVGDIGELDDLMASLAPRHLLLEGLVDGRNRFIPEATFRTRLAIVYDAYGAERAQLLIRSRSGMPGFSQWMLTSLVSPP
jgi:hypothetical protein